MKIRDVIAARLFLELFAFSSITATSGCFQSADCGCKWGTSLCNVTADKRTCGCAPDAVEGNAIPSDYEFSDTCTPATVSVDKAAACCALSRYPLADQCLCRADEKAASCALMGNGWRPISSCAIGGVLTSQ
jgi:hypothetical protein